MTVGTVICVAEGIVAYRNTGIVDSLAPIMEAPKKNKVAPRARLLAACVYTHFMS